MKEFNGDRIRTLRERNNLTQKQLAEAFGITEQAVSGWETSGVKRESTLKQIADYFSSSVEWLKTGKELNQNFYNTGRNNTATNKVNIGGYSQAGDPFVAMLERQINDLKEELARCREQNEKLLERLLSK